MDLLVVVNQLKDWPLDVPGIRVVAARSYLMDPEFSRLRRARVFNLCRHYKYQSTGYYVSLLAEARGHRPMPSVMTLQELRSPAVVGLASDELEERIQRSLAPIQSERFTLSIYFGRNVAKRHTRLANALFKLFPSPFLRATFSRDSEGDWSLRSIVPMPASQIPPDHLDFAVEQTRTYMGGRIRSISKPGSPRFDLAILWDDKDPVKPSDEKALKKFVKAAEGLEMAVEVIGKDDYGRLSEFDALFIRVTTAVNHYTYRFAQRAHAEGLVVIDDPLSILRCTNKVYLAEILARAGVPTPETRIVHKDNLKLVVEELGFPLILKQPDSSSSLGVVKVDRLEELNAKAGSLFENSDLLIAQEFMPTDFDWRVGILNRIPLYISKYFMAKKHWQIINHASKGTRGRYGQWETLAVEDAPKGMVNLALKAANLIGDGFYGVDLKQVGNKWFVIEVNDNPSVETKVEDLVLKDQLYLEIMKVLLSRIERRKEGRSAK
ncbi:RimK family protein [bacterium]|nr:RimK family protein [bacterium]